MTASSDLVARLRARKLDEDSGMLANWCWAAADEVERLYSLAKANNALARRHATTILALEAEKAALHGALTELRDTVQASGKLEGREYIGVGIRVNDTLAKHGGDK